MEIRVKTENKEKIKKILSKYKKENIEYNEPHFSLKLDRQKIDKKEVIRNILKPNKLVLVGVSESKNPSYKYVHDLYFKLGKKRIFKIPVSIKPKSLYLITIFKIKSKIQNEAIKYYKK
ncbi:hypothetical protein CL618_02915 [archaeon]|nr:hypothetical protein [archaeon]|tara:strand:- start:8368 stop:8724 length:357 start_codon:yes stop_codon:yes gene_type:complete